jgi:ADP-heptose:LPS heptosyltransferase
MKKVLFTLLRSETDTIKAARIIGAFRENNPHHEVSILTYEDIKGPATIIKGVSQIYSINRQELTSILNSDIYSDALALDQFTESIEELRTTEWDTVVNLSNDNVSSYLVSGLNAQEIIGSHIGNFGSVVTTNSWNTYLNSVSSKETTRTISLSDVKSHMLSSPITPGTVNINMNEEYTREAAANFTKIRSLKGGDIKVIALSLTDGVNGEYIEESYYTEIIETLESNEKYKVVLLSNRNNYEIDLINNLNGIFNNSLITISSDITVLPSVLVNIDCVIGCSNTTLALAESVDVPTIEITQDVNKALSEHEDRHIIEARDKFVDDIYFALNQRFETILPVESMNSNNPTYEIFNDEYGVMRSLTRGPIDINTELNYHLKRCYNYALLGYPVNHALIRNLQTQVEKTELTTYVENVKEEITLYVKTLLNALRSLKTTKENGQNTETFIKCLDFLIHAGQDDTLPSAALGLLEGRIENITSTDAQENINQIEKYLFELKSDLQMLTNIFGDLLSSSRETEVTK